MREGRIGQDRYNTYRSQTSTFSHHATVYEMTKGNLEYKTYERLFVHENVEKKNCSS